MRRCLFCGFELPADARFCPQCGRSQDPIEDQESKTTLTDASALQGTAASNQSASAGGSSGAAWAPPVVAPSQNNPSSPSWAPPAPAQSSPSAPSWAPQTGPSAGSWPPPGPPSDPYSGGAVPQQPTGEYNQREDAAAPTIPPPPPLFPVEGAAAATNAAPTVYGAPPAGNVPMMQGTGPYGGLGAQGTAVPGSFVPGAAGATKAAQPWIASAVGKIVIAAVAVVVVAAGSLAAVYALTRPQPVIGVNSSYHVGKTPAGAPGTTLHISGHDFSGTSAITFLLDGHAAPGSPHVQSDNKGNLNADLPITSAWSPGKHTLTAKDAGGYATKTGVLVLIVAAGQANTPGPNNAPPDSSSFSLHISMQGSGESGTYSYEETLTITGRPDPAGGSVCGQNEDGQRHTYSSSTYNSSTPFSRTYAMKCDGTYKAGKISDTVTLTYSVATFTDSNTGVKVTCTAPVPTTNLTLTGTFTSATEASGTFNYPHIQYSCDESGASFWNAATSGTWTGIKE